MKSECKLLCFGGGCKGYVKVKAVRFQSIGQKEGLLVSTTHKTKKFSFSFI